MQNLQFNPISPLELAMRDVLDGMDDFACGFAYQSTPGVFEILAIEPPETPSSYNDAA